MNTHLLSPEVVTRINMMMCGAQSSVLDAGKLDGALARPMQQVFGVELFPTDIHRAAALLDALSRAHPFADGNKRTSWICAVTYLGLCGITLSCGQIEAGRKVVDLVTHEIVLEDVVEWMQECAVSREASE